MRVRGCPVLFGNGIIATSYSITVHYPGYFHGCWFDQALSRCIKALLFFQAAEKEARTALLWQ